MQEWIIQMMNDYGYIGIFLLVALENVFPPIPSEIILTFGGFMTLSTKMNFIGVVLSATAGAVFGAIILYSLGALLKQTTLERILDGKIGKILGFKKEDVAKSIEWFNKKGMLTVLFTRFIPVVRSLISIPAGTTRMPLLAFTLYTTIGTFIWNIVLVWLGLLAGENWSSVANIVDEYSHIAVIVLAVLVIAVIGYIILRKRKKTT